PQHAPAPVATTPPQQKQTAAAPAPAAASAAALTPPPQHRQAAPAMGAAAPAAAPPPPPQHRQAVASVPAATKAGSPADPAPSPDTPTVSAPVEHRPPSDRVAAMTKRPQPSGAGSLRPGSPEAGTPTPVQVTLADADEYLAWDRAQSCHQKPKAAGGTVATAEFGSLNLPESSLAENPIHASTTVEAAPGPEPARDVAAGSPTAESPIWSEPWKAWVYRDPASDRWFRHDTEHNGWRPLN
ncbi:MAG: hypothetical protein ACR2QK_23640, partial [Acidimicrobiales bacterium]